MSRLECYEHYRQAVRQGKKYFSDSVASGRTPYPQVLDDLVEDMMSTGRVELGVQEIPIENVTGTLAAGRKSAFAGNFMPLLDPKSEFASKWISLCEAHLTTTGITDPIKCYEYLWHYYVQEGHKRVSVLRYFEAPTIRAEVTRIVPPWSEEPEIQAYYDYMSFYKLSEVSSVQFRRPGCYARLQAALGMAPDHVWTVEERKSFALLWSRMQDACDPRLLEDAGNVTPSEVLLTCLEMYPLEEVNKLDSAELKKRITAMLPDLRFIARDEPTAVSTDIPEIPAKGLINQIIDGLTRPTLNIAFVHASDPDVSFWSHGHDLGRQRMEEKLGDQVKVRSYIVGEKTALETMEDAVKDGAQVLFATAPALIEAARQCAAAHPGLKTLVCALAMPYAGVRTYYSRTYEAQFITGALAGVLCGGAPVGYLARYPIMGIPAAVNAFALGLRMTSPQSRVILDWTCIAGDPVTRLWFKDVRIISGHENIAQEKPAHREDWSMVRLIQDHRPDALASVAWNWAKIYEQLVRSILGGAWDSVNPTNDSAVSYWWGMNSGAITVKLADGLPSGAAQLAEILKAGMKENRIHPFACPVTDQSGKVWNPEGLEPDAEELMRMDWFCNNVEGRLPEWEELLPMSRRTTRLLAVRRDGIPAGKETAQP